jgi:hypothetical protein
LTTGEYKIIYTTSPKKSYVVVPENGEIKYEKYKERDNDKLLK